MTKPETHHERNPERRPGKFYCTADVGMAVAKKELRGNSFKMPPGWLITPDTLQKCNISLDNNKRSAQTA
jgi:hypothetical protein